jgi:hypothetical protein
MLGSWYSWGRGRVPRLALKPDSPWFMTTCKTPLLVSLLAKLQELPVSQLAKHVNLFHLVITDNGDQQPSWSLGGTPSLSHGVVPPIKPPTHSSWAAALWARESAWQSVLPINLSFLHMAWALFCSSLHKVVVISRLYC